MGLTSVEHSEELGAIRHTIVLKEDERQTILLALAELSIARPGWVQMLSDIARQMDNTDPRGEPQMFEQFRQNHVAPLVEAIKNAP